MVEVKLRTPCLECSTDGKDPRPDCPECKGTGWVEFWASLERLARGIRRGEPIDAVAHLDKQAKKWAGED